MTFAFLIVSTAFISFIIVNIVFIVFKWIYDFFLIEKITALNAFNLNLLINKRKIYAIDSLVSKWLMVNSSPL